MKGDRKYIFSVLNVYINTYVHIKHRVYKNYEHVIHFTLKRMSPYIYKRTKYKTLHMKGDRKYIFLVYSSSQTPKMVVLDGYPVGLH